MPPSPSAPGLRYRPDIDGLRALAILPVVFYHFKIPGFSGGFVGVDIFFVISGYLITGLLAQTERPLTLAGFYARRIRRLTPALAAMLIAATLGALVLLPPTSLVTYGESLASVALGLSNVYFWRVLASYFAVSGASQPLLHTWSLAVEEQFYLLFPLFLVIAGRFGGRWRLIGVVVGCVASFGLAAWLAPRAPSGSFYLAPTRAWELLAGCSLALAPQRWAGSDRWVWLLGAAGLVLLAVAVTTFGPQSQVPGLAAAIPCLGAVLLIHIGQANPDNAISRLLSARPLVGVGLISYALYLWHWPINVYLRRYVVMGALDPWTTAAAIVAAFALAAASWFLIERPLRQGPLLARPSRAFAFLALFAASAVGVGAGLWSLHGLPARYPELQAASLPVGERPKPAGLLEPTTQRHTPVSSRWLFQNDDARARRVMIWGDSYARRLAAGFVAIQAETPFSVFFHEHYACPPVLGFDPPSNPTCRGHNDRTLEQVRSQHIDTVVITGRWDTYTSTGKLRLAQIADTVRRLRAMGLEVIIVGQPPTFAFDYPNEYHLLQMRRGARPDEGWAPNMLDPTLNARLGEAVGAGFFDPSPVFCKARLCAYRREGQFVVTDSGHLSDYGAALEARSLLRLPQLQGAR